MRTLVGKMKNGSRIKIKFEDLSDFGPIARDANGKSFRVYTSKFESDRFGTVYSQVDVQLAEASGDIEGFRHSEDSAALSNLGVDVDSLQDEVDANYEERIAAKLPPPRAGKKFAQWLSGLKDAASRL